MQISKIFFVLLALVMQTCMAADLKLFRSIWPCQDAVSLPDVKTNPPSENLTVTINTAGIATFSFPQRDPRMFAGHKMSAGGIDYYLRARRSFWEWEVQTKYGAKPDPVSNVVVSYIKPWTHKLAQAISNFASVNLRAGGTLGEKGGDIVLLCTPGSQADTAAVTISGITCDTNHRLYIMAPRDLTMGNTICAHRRNKPLKWRSDLYRLEVASGISAIKTNPGNDRFVTIDGVQIKLKTNQEIAQAVLKLQHASTVRRCFIWMHSDFANTRERYGIWASQDADNDIENNVIVFTGIHGSIQNIGIYSHSSSGSSVHAVHAYHNFIHGYKKAFQTNSAYGITAKNNIVACTTFTSNGYLDSCADYNCTYDSNAPGFHNIQYSNMTVHFADSSGTFPDQWNLHLKGNSPLIGNGDYDLISEHSVKDDFVTELAVRPESAPCIGPVEYIPEGNTSTGIGNRYRQKFNPDSTPGTIMDMTDPSGWNYSPIVSNGTMSFNNELQLQIVGNGGDTDIVTVAKTFDTLMNLSESVTGKNFLAVELEFIPNPGNNVKYYMDSVINRLEIEFVKNSGSNRAILAYYYWVPRIQDDSTGMVYLSLVSDFTYSNANDSSWNGITGIKFHLFEKPGYKKANTIKINSLQLINSQLPRGAFSFQMDDGNSSVWEYFKPMMSQYGFKASLFINPGNIDHIVLLDNKKSWTGGSISATINGTTVSQNFTTDGPTTMRNLAQTIVRSVPNVNTAIYWSDIGTDYKNKFLREYGRLYISFKQDYLKDTTTTLTASVKATTDSGNKIAFFERAYLTTAQLRSLQNDYGWEICSHGTMHHEYFSSMYKDRDEMKAIMLETQKWLNDSGLTSGNRFVRPPGAGFDLATVNSAMKVYDWFAIPSSAYKLVNPIPWTNMSIMEAGYPNGNGNNTLARLQQMVDKAQAYKALGVVVGHRVALGNDDVTWEMSKFLSLIEKARKYYDTGDLDVVIMSQIFERYE